MDIPAITGRLPEGAKRRKYIDAIGEWEAAGTKPPSGNADACTKATGDGRIPTRRTRNPAARMAEGDLPVALTSVAGAVRRASKPETERVEPASHVCASRPAPVVG